MLTPPSWYDPIEQWMLGYGWPLLLLVSAVIIGVTLYLIATKRAIPLALWLTYLVSP